MPRSSLGERARLVGALHDLDAAALAAAAGVDLRLDDPRTRRRRSSRPPRAASSGDETRPRQRRARRTRQDLLGLILVDVHLASGRGTGDRSRDSCAVTHGSRRCARQRSHTHAARQAPGCGGGAQPSGARLLCGDGERAARDREARLGREADERRDRAAGCARSRRESPARRATCRSGRSSARGARAPPRRRAGARPGRPG